MKNAGLNDRRKQDGTGGGGNHRPNHNLPDTLTGSASVIPQGAPG